MSRLHPEESRHDFAFIAGVIIGAISGALVTLALTPMSGAETREKLRHRAEDLGPVKEKAASMAAPVREKATTMAGPMRERAGSIATTAAGTAQHLAATGKERASELAHKAPISRGERTADGLDVDEANAMLEDTNPDAYPGGTVTAAALSDAGQSSTAHGTASGSNAGGRADRAHTQEPAEGAVKPGGELATADSASAHTQQPAEGPRDVDTDSGNGRVSESPSGGAARPDA